MNKFHLSMPSKKVAIKPFLFETVLFILFVFTSCSQKQKAQEVLSTEGISHYQYYNDITMWNNIFNSSDSFLLPEEVCPRAVMVPHHDIAIKYQNSFYKALSELDSKPQVIFIVSPDHFERGKNLITMPKDTVFSAPDGELEVDYDIISKIQSDSEISSYVSLQDDVWFDEHGIFAHTPFIKHYFDNVKIVPIVLKMLSDESDFEIYKKLGKVISQFFPSQSNAEKYSMDGLFIASVDCSHYQIPRVTKFHDDVIVNTIIRSEDPRFAEIDSPESMTALFSFNENLNLDYPVLIHQSSTYDFVPDDMAESTSHLYISYYEKQNNLNSSINNFYEKVSNTQQRGRKINTDEIAQTLFFAGSGKTGAGIRKTWTWDRYDTSTNSADKLLKTAGGKEGRFLYGYDALIFDSEPGVYQRTLHGTNLVVNTIYQSEFEALYDSLNKSLSLEKIIPYPDKTIIVLEVILQGDKKIPSDDIVFSMCKKYDVIVFRDDDGLVDAYLYCRESAESSKCRKINMGICHGNGPIKGSVVMITFAGSQIDLESFEYESSTGILPEICQVYPAPGTPLLSEGHAPGDREN